MNAYLALPLGGAIACDGGALRLEKAVIDARTHALCHLVVSLPYRPWFRAVLNPRALTVGADGQPYLPVPYEEARARIGRIRPGQQTSGAETVDPDSIICLRRQMRVEAGTGRVGRLTRVIVDRARGKVTEIVIRPRGLWPRQERRIPIERVCYATRSTILLDCPPALLEHLPPYHDDACLAALVRAALDRREWIRRLEGRDVAIAVRGGVVTLSGNVTDLTARNEIGRLAAAVPGVRAVENRLVCDDDLDRAVAQALAADADLRRYSLSVHTVHGTVGLSGAVPSGRLWSKAALLARDVPGVRAVRNEVLIAEPVAATEPVPAQEGERREPDAAPVTLPERPLVAAA